MLGGADVAGLLNIDSSFLSTNVNNALVGKPADAIAAVIRVGATREVLDNVFVDGGFRTDEYLGHDLLLFVNLSLVSLSNPQLSIGNSTNPNLLRPLSLGGFTNNSSFGGTGNRQTLSVLNQNAVVGNVDTESKLDDQCKDR